MGRKRGWSPENGKNLRWGGGGKGAKELGIGADSGDSQRKRSLGNPSPSGSLKPFFVSSGIFAVVGSLRRPLSHVHPESGAAAPEKPLPRPPSAERDPRDVVGASPTLGAQCCRCDRLAVKDPVFLHSESARTNPSYLSTQTKPGTGGRRSTEGVWRWVDGVL